MKTRLYDWVKLFLENKAVTLALLGVLLPSVGANVYMSQKPAEPPKPIQLPIPAKVEKVAEKPTVDYSRLIEASMQAHLKDLH